MSSKVNTMSSKNLLTTIKGNKDEIIEDSTYIEVTNRTLRFGAKVYQFRNITGFGLTSVGKKIIVPILVIVIVLLYGVFVFFTSSFTGDGNGMFWGVLMVLLSLAGYAVNEKQPLRYGFLLELNSGSDRIFVTQDLEGVKEIVSKLYKLMESELEGVYKINIDQRHASIGVGYTEKLNAKNVGGSIHNNKD